MENKCSQVQNIERVQALEAWLEMTNTKLTQVNGQRKYGGPPEGWDGPTPGERCEVFISHIPRDAYEDLLIPLFSSVGPLWEFRLMMNFSGQNRGFAYAKYGTPALATEAVLKLNGYMLEPKSYLCVRRSTEKRHLCIGNLPAATKQEDLKQVLRRLVEGVERVSLKTGPGIEGVSAVVAFSSHHTASMAKKDLVAEFKKRFLLEISINWEPGENPNPSKTCSSPAPKILLQPCFVPCSQAVSQPSPPPVSPGFCRAVGEPVSSPHPHVCYPVPASHHPQQHLVCTPSPTMLLRKVCEANGFGQPLYDLHYSLARPDGFVKFTYKVLIPGISSAFRGKVMVLPGPSVRVMMEEAQRAAAQQLLQKLFHNQQVP
ncbi:dead end protein 1 isoform X1 [Gambusia affinis]|uniref:dead end protein 1 isoform X1 n=2 Tax=Gambusia affinis TaxID=33528 RepID=UPI001CDD2C73|nr:dead end protein 1 isoform X1 [Gambusia affinis]